ncbi:restriction endonuclease subunit S [Vibrio cyclitrophicus]|nr:restriction endonuclease subunit S [Vibrio cyclitrophicus]UPR54869.1 restriction endonuclease subunit S [Vibrio cyclitrophicus]
MSFNGKLSDVVNIIGGGTPKRSIPDYWGEGIPWLSVADFNSDSRYVDEAKESITIEGLEKSSTKLLKSGMLIISARGTVGCLAQLTKEMAFNQSCYGLDGKRELIQNNYLYYLVKQKVSELQKKGHGAVFNTITRETFDHISIELPSLEVQSNISGILGAIDNKIANNKSMNQTLEKIAQRIFKSWFIDFDPVKANKEGLPFDGLSPEVQALFPNDFEVSELGMIPKGWNVEPLSSLININPKRTIKKGTVTHHIDMKVLPTSSMSINGVSSKEFKSGTKFINHDTLLARITPCLENGKTAYVNCIPGNDIAWGSTEFIVMNPKNEYIREYTYLLARSDELRAYAIKNMTGTSGRQRVSGALIGEFQIPQPDENIIKAFHKITASLFAKISLNTANSVALEKTRDRLLPKLISGQISVSEAKQELAEAV